MKEQEIMKQEMINELFGPDVKSIDDQKAVVEIIYNYEELEQKILDLIAVYDDMPECKDAITTLLEELQAKMNNICRFKINQIAEKFFQAKIDVVLSTISQEKIIMIFEHALNNYPLKQRVLIELKEMASKMNRRFTFDDAALINLIEASNLRNIQTEEGFTRRNGDDKLFLREDPQKGYIFSPKSTYFTHTHNNKTITSYINEGDILPETYPFGKETIAVIKNRDEILKQIITNVLDNLQLCFDTFQRYYLDGKLGNGFEVKNDVTLPNNGHFSFAFRLFEKNLPHILGIPSVHNLPIETKGILGLNEDRQYGTNEVLKAILDKKDLIISQRGLIGKDVKYEMLPWEKIVLKTSSFIRGNFFKDCFCIVKLADDKYLQKPGDEIEYVGITSTRYKEGLNTNRANVNDLLNELIKARKQSKDFIFTGFIYDSKSKLYIPKTNMTAKAENIRVGKDKELLLTLEKYRKMLEESTGGVAEVIENENGRRKFNPYEQASLHLDVKSELGAKVNLSEEALLAEYELAQSLDDDLHYDKGGRTSLLK